jgi:ATP-dependent Lhr-like helicase
VVLSDGEIFAELSGGGRHLVSGFPGFTEAQRLAIPAILDRQATLLIARTASGKTEAVLAPLLTLHFRERWKGRPSIVYVAPTRALVNDLHGRLADRLAAYVDVGRKTGEYQDPDCQLLITTPESLDSMLVRRWGDDGHLLTGVRAIVLDELHLLAESARGTQLQILLARLDRIATAPVLRLGLSATVPDPVAMAARYLGPDAVVRTGTGSRTLEIDRCPAPEGIPDRETGPDPLASRILRAGNGSDGYAAVATRLVELRKEIGGLKALVFVPSRARCDRLSGSLGAHFEGRVPLRVHAHHGSLDKAYREETEEAMSDSEEAVAVATSTLEVGIDIGDVGVVALLRRGPAAGEHPQAGPVPSDAGPRRAAVRVRVRRPRELDPQ